LGGLLFETLLTAAGFLDTLSSLYWFMAEEMKPARLAKLGSRRFE
tara:strand:+ start:209 stop:343 length:135 start_codon:yes stop_codon:yes gene_type:complete